MQYFSIKNGYGFKKNELIGNLINGQFVLAIGERGAEQSLERFSLVPDTWLIGSGSGTTITMFDLRKSISGLRKKEDLVNNYDMNILVIDSLRPKGCRPVLFPLSVEESAQVYVENLLSQIIPDMEIKYWYKKTQPVGGDRRGSQMVLAGGQIGSKAYDAFIYMKQLFHWIATEIILNVQDKPTQTWRNNEGKWEQSG